MKFFYNKAIILMVGVVAIMVLAESIIIEMQSCPNCSADTPVPCVRSHPATQRFCPGQSATANITLKLSQDLMNNLTLANVKVMVHDLKFSQGSLISGRFHNGDKLVDRWTIRISFEGNTVTYELLNAKIEFKDVFPCRLEIDIGGNKFISKYFQWFDVDNRYCMPSTRIPKTDMDTTDAPEQESVSLVDQLKNMSSAINTLSSEIISLRKQNAKLRVLLHKLTVETNSNDPQREIIPKDVTDQLDTLNNIGMVLLALLSILVLQCPAALKMIQLMYRLSSYFPVYRLLENLSERNHGIFLCRGISASEADIEHCGSQTSVLISPEDERAKPEDDRAKPEDERAKPQDERAKPQDERANTEDEHVKSEDERAKPQDERAKPQDESAKPEDERVKPQDERAKPQDDRAKPQDERAKPEDERAKPQDERAKPQDEHTKSQ